MGSRDNERDVHLYQALEDVRNSNLKDRLKHVKTLRSIFDGSERANLNALSDKAFHKIYEILFRLTLEEKANVLGAKKNTTTTALNRLTACADVVRLAIKAGAPKIKTKTVEAVVDHIVQTLPKADGEFFEPLSPYYLKSLCAVFEYKPNVERLSPNTWREAATFCLQSIDSYLDDNSGESSSFSRSVSGLGAGNAPSASYNQNKTGNISRQNADDLLLSLLYLVSAPNAPLLELCHEIVSTLLRFLSSQGSAVSSLHQSAFSALNAVLLFCREDRCALLQSVAQEVVPIISRFWQGKTSAKDEMFISVRDEMLILLLTVQLHLERTILDDESTTLFLNLEDLLSVMKVEYARRSDRDRLQLDDLDMVDLGSVTSHRTTFRLQSFGLRAHNIKAERYWANLQVIGILERLVSIGELKHKPTSETAGDDDANKHPRKRQRIAQPTDRLIDPIRLEDESTRLTGLQALPFLLQSSTLPASVLVEVLSQLNNCTSDKRGQIASWALLAIASCTHQQLVSEEHAIDWVPLWHAGARALTFPATCRAASVALHAIIAAKLVQYRDIGEDIQAIVTTPDTNGPVVLCDSAVFLMMHLLNVRVSEVPGASLVSCNHVIRWLFARWNPSDRSFAIHLTVHIQPHILVDLLRTTLGLARVKLPLDQSRWGGLIAQAWEQHMSTQTVVRYLLLLDDAAPIKTSSWCSSCPKYTRGSDTPYILESAHFQQARKLILELLKPKLSDLLETWRSHATDRGTALSIETFRRAIYGCITILLLMPHFASTNSSQFDSLEADLNSLVDEIVKLLDQPETRDTRETQVLVEALLQAVQPNLPSCGSHQFIQLSEKMPHLLHFFVSITELFEQKRDTLSTVDAAAGEDLMDLDGFTPDQGQSRTEQKKNLIPRQDVALDMSPDSFNIMTRERVMLITAVSDSSLSIGSVPSVFIDQILGMPVEELLSSRNLLLEILRSDLIIGETDASRLLEHLGTLMAASEWSRCETMHNFCLNILIGLGSLWFQPNGSDLADYGLQLYGWFIKVALDQKVASQNVQKGIARLLLLLMKLDTDTEPLSEIRSPRTSLFNILKESSASVKFYIGNQLQEIFHLFLLKDHDGVFVDILKSLPTNQDWIEGIAFRLFVLAQLASHWATLLRRCIYHIFEIPPRIVESVRHATRCLTDVSSALKVEGPRELFSLFAPQLLYTWLEFESIREIPFQIFGFASLKNLVKKSQHVAAGLMVMRGQEEGIRILSELLEISELEVLQRCFTNIMAYSIAYSTSIAPTDKSKKQIMGEMWVKRQLGNDLFFECVNSHFPDILALLFNTIDQGDVEKYLMKNEDLIYAGNIMKEIKSISSSSVVLPPNQQPMFKARHLTVWISHLCGRTQYEAGNLYTPALVVSIARTLLNTIHSALGSLHTCSVIRKIRLLVSLSGEVAVEGYPVEMLLRSVSAFITDTECADDCFGIIQYLLTRASQYLVQSPSFFAGISLSILGSLGLLVRSPQSSITQDSQYKATMSKAENFRRWMTKHVSEYESPALQNQSRAILPAIVKSADSIGTAGNAYIGTPESYLLFHLLEDEQIEESLLSRPSREAAVAMLCSNFKSPASYREDLFGSDELSIANAAVVWKSCRSNFTNSQYLTWAGKVLGRAFAASGHVHQELLQESSLSQIEQLADISEEDSSRGCVLSLLQTLTMDQSPQTVGLAEVALRVIVTTDDIFLAESCQRHLSKSLNEASMWAPYQIPISQAMLGIDDIDGIDDPFTSDAIFRPLWLRDFTVALAQFVPADPVLRALVPILYGVPGFPARAFPFILHLVLSTPSQSQPLTRKRVSDAFKTWFKNSVAIDRNNLKMLINSVLYLRTQPLADEKSSADRSRWLDIDYSKAATAATNCGMFKTALLFVEEFCSGPVLTKSSRRSSAVNPQTHELPTELLLTIYHNIDDPDLYYGVQQTASLSTILARLEYEKDGPKSLAFRGAQYDSHIRRKDSKSSQDVESLVKALDVLNLSGLSHSLLQSQPTVGMSATLLESMFSTARKLEQWDIPVPDASNDDGITIYKAFQAIQKAADNTAVLHAINEGVESTMLSLVREDLSASALHSSLRTLAALVEVDEVLSSRGSVEFEELLGRFRARSNWMETGRFDDISQILSCRGTTLSILSEQPRLRDIIGLVPVDARLVEVQTILLSSRLSRSHNALQESLSLATSLMDLIVPCQALDLNLEAAIHLEAANALWDQGEMTSSIGMLQALNRNESLKHQTIPIGRSDLLSRIGFQVSVARLEIPDQILENYLKPALEELKGKVNGSEASHVFHQFATFCDQQLQDADGLEDLERLQKLTENKRGDVATLTKMFSSASTTAEKSRYRGPLSKNKAWLKLDEGELQRHTKTREEFLRQSLQNYLLALIASDEHDKNTLRFTALWLEHSEEEMANQAVSKHLQAVPSHKFAPLMNQLTSRLQDTNAEFQQLLFELVLRICIGHPYHSMYQIYAGANYDINQKDDSATSRKKATSKVTKQISTNPSSSQIWTSIFTTNKVYGQLAAEKDEQRYRSGKKIPLRESIAGARLSSMLSRFPIPSPTMQIQLSAVCDYSKVPTMVRFDPIMGIASGVSSPKIITAIASNGAQYKQLVKGGNDDLRQDAIMEQVFEQVSELLKANRSTRQRDLRIRTYKVLPLTSVAGVIEFVADTIPLHEYLMPAHEKYYPKDLKGNQCRKEIGDVQSQTVPERIKRFRSVTDRFHPVMRYFFTEKFNDPDDWFLRRLAYTRSTAAISILGHVLGVGDRHGHNILLDTKSGEVVHIDLGVAFEMGRVLPVPELVPFRLTRDIVDGMGITKTEGVFRRCCEFTLEALRKEAYSIMTILDVLRYDPLYSWSMSPVQVARLQEGQSAAANEPGGILQKTKETNGPGEADRALTVVNKKLSKTLSVTATVNDLINQATDEEKLAVLYSGWAAYA